MKVEPYASNSEIARGERIYRAKERHGGVNPLCEVCGCPVIWARVERGEVTCSRHDGARKASPGTDETRRRAAQIKRRLSETGVYQRDLARVLVVSEAEMSEYLSGRREMSEGFYERAKAALRFYGSCWPYWKVDGRPLRYIRSDAGVSRVAVGEASGIGRHRLRNIELGLKRPTRETYERIERVIRRIS